MKTKIQKVKSYKPEIQDEKNFSSSISINVIFDKNLEKITGTSGHKVAMSTSANFMFLLNSIFMEYPKMMKVCKPGELGFTINGYPPKQYSPLFDGDEVVFKMIK